MFVNASRGQMCLPLPGNFAGFCILSIDLGENSDSKLQDNCFIVCPKFIQNQFLLSVNWTSNMNLRGAVPLHNMSVSNTAIKSTTEVNSIKTV